MKDSSYKRHIAKTITWRIVGSLDTIILGSLISGSSLLGLKIGLAEVLTKMLLYYLHERIWFYSFLRTISENWKSRNRHLVKTFTWRIIGTIDTAVLAWIITENPMTGLKIGMAEIITKMGLYYFHERVWYKSNYGLDERAKE